MRTMETSKGIATVKRRHFVWVVLLLAVSLILPTAPALAQSDPPDNGTVIWNEDYTLEEGERLDGDLIVVNGDVTLEEGSYVEGSVIVWLGSVSVEGTVEGDLVVSSGDIYLGDNADVDGQVVCTWKCAVEQEEGARVGGGVVEVNPLETLRFGREGRLPIPVPSPLTFWASGPGQALAWVLKFIRGLAAILVVAAVAGLVALIWPGPTAQIGRAVVDAPWHSFGIGLLTIIAATVAIIILTITICLSPVALLAAIALGAAGLFGWIGIGAVVGERLLQALNVRGLAPLWDAGLGTLLVTLICIGLSAALCLAPIGWLAIFVLGCLGLGAVALTRFGAAAYVPPTGSGYYPPSPPPPSPAPTPPEPLPVEEPEPSEAQPEPEPEPKEEEAGHSET